MNSLEKLKNAGVTLIDVPKLKEDVVEIHADGDYNDGDYVKEIYNISVDKFIKHLPAFQKFDGDLENIEDSELSEKEQELIQQYTPGGAPDDCNVHTLDLEFYLLTTDGKKYTLNI